MHVDAFTILLFGLFIKAMLGALFFVFWLNDRRGAVWFAWWSATFAFGSLSASLFLLRGFGAEFVSIGIGVASPDRGVRLLLAGRARLRPAAAAVAAGAAWRPALWLAACLVPDFIDTTSYRVVLSSALLAPLLAMCAVEFWRGRQEPLPSRWPVIVLFATLALFFAARIPLVDVLPFPFGALPMQPGWIGGFQSDRVLSHAHAERAARGDVQGASRARPAHEGADRSVDRRAQPARIRGPRRAPGAAPQP